MRNNNYYKILLYEYIFAITASVKKIKPKDSHLLIFLLVVAHEFVLGCDWLNLNLRWPLYKC